MFHAEPAILTIIDRFFCLYFCGCRRMNAEAITAIPLHFANPIAALLTGFISRVQMECIDYENKYMLACRVGQSDLAGDTQRQRGRKGFV